MVRYASSTMSTTPRAWIAKDGSYEWRAARLRQTSDHDVRRRRGRRQADGDVDEIQVVQVTLTSGILVAVLVNVYAVAD